MKKFTSKKAALIAALCICTCTSFAQRLLTENFNYAPGQLTAQAGGANVSGGSWIYTSGSGNYVPVVAGTLSYPDYLTNPGVVNNNKASITAYLASAEDLYTPFATQTTGTVYASFLLNVRDQVNMAENTGTGDFFTGFLSSTSVSAYNQGRVYIRKGGAANTFNLGITTNTPASTPIVFSATDYAIGTTHLVTFSYTIIAGTFNDVAKLFVNAPLSSVEPTPDAVQTIVAGTEAVDVARFFLRQGAISSTLGPTTPNADIDAIKVSTSYTDVALPLNLTSFNASLIDKNVQLNWATANEQNVQSFSIERGNDSRNFLPVGMVLARNTNQASYTFWDNAPLVGISFYRLKITDKDGNVKMSSVVAINNRKGIVAQVFPNPVVNNISVVHSSAGTGASIKIINAAGQQVKAFNVQEGATQTGLLVAGLKAGSYLLSYNNNGEKTVTKFIKN